MRLRFSSQQPPGMYTVQYFRRDQLQPRIKHVTQDLQPARSTAGPYRRQNPLFFINFDPGRAK